MKSLALSSRRTWVTLGLAALNLVTISSRIVEPLIAVSIWSSVGGRWYSVTSSPRSRS